ncbi:MAG: hypothetical protein H8E64_05185 [Candidatus Marinimicrobia bacterium]|nr:hypothetical protein [Candidatus Neomarinimicrobiota bacterium]
MKFKLNLTLFSLGSWGLISGIFFPQYIWEIFLGMIGPLVVGIVTVTLVKNTFEISNEKLTATMAKAFFIKMIFYGVYVSVIIGFSSFDSPSYIISFAAYFSVLHMFEAMYFRTLFNSK